MLYVTPSHIFFPILLHPPFEKGRSGSPQLVQITFKSIISYSLRTGVLEAEVKVKLTHLTDVNEETNSRWLHHTRKTFLRVEFVGAESHPPGDMVTHAQ